jgi:hypothetical protein
MGKQDHRQRSFCLTEKPGARRFLCGWSRPRGVACSCPPGGIHGFWRCRSAPCNNSVTPRSPRVSFSCIWRATSRAYSRVPPILRFLGLAFLINTMYHEPRSFLSLTDISEAPTFFQFSRPRRNRTDHLGCFLSERDIVLPVLTIRSLSSSFGLKAINSDICFLCGDQPRGIRVKNSLVCFMPLDFIGFGSVCINIIGDGQM